jgi:hypothetical protein
LGVIKRKLVGEAVGGRKGGRKDQVRKMGTIKKKNYYYFFIWLHVGTFMDY